MSNNDAELRIGGDSSGLTEACKTAEQAVKQSFDKMQSSMASLGGALQKLQGTFIAVTAILAGGKAFKEFIDASMEEANAVIRLERVFGMTADSATVLNVALKLTGQSAEEFAGMAFKLLKHVETNGEGMEKLGVKTRDATTGGLRPMMDLMTNAADVLLQYKEGADRDAAAMYFFGRSAQDAMGILKLNAEVMARANMLADQYNLKTGEEGVAAAEKFKIEQAALGIMFDAMKVKVGDAVMPVLTQLAGWFSEVGPTVIDVFLKGLKQLIQFFEETVFGFRMLYSAASDFGVVFVALADGLSNAMSRLMHGDFSGAKQAITDSLDAIKGIWKQNADDRVRIEAETNERIRKLWAGETDTGSKPDAKKPKGTKTWKNPDEKGGAEKSQMGAFDAELAQTKVAYQMTHDLREMTKKEEIAWWNEKKALTTTGSNDQITISKKTAELQLEILKKNAKDGKELSTEAIGAREKAANDALAVDEQAAQQKQAMGQITQQQLLALEQGFEDKRFEIQQQAQADRITAMLGDPNMDPVALQKMLDQMLDIQREHALKLGKIQNATALETRKSQESMLAPVTSAIEKTVNGMIQGTLTLKKALSNIFQSILGEFVSVGAKLVATWLLDNGKMTAVSKAFSALKTALWGEEAAAKVTSDTAAAAGSKVFAAATIPAEAATAAGGAASAVASIPYVGPAMAAAAYAETFAMVMAGMGAASASGGFDIPSGVNPLTQLHQEEMVLPAHIANPLRESLAGGGGGSGGAVHLHVHALDVKGVKDWMKTNSHAMAPALRQIARNFTPVRA
jgi:hypothetical protein